jgi:hypothetical protein
MIRYDLVCADGHEFDGWFRDSAAYDAAERMGEVACTQCGSTKVEKQLMAPGIPAKANRRSEVSTPVAGGVMDPRAAAMLKMMREVRAKVEASAEYVGPRFAEEARKIHYEETEARGIYGEASPQETRALVEEGIEVHPLPRLPEDGN